MGLEVEQQSIPLSNEKHCEMLAANARVAGDAMRDGFKLFVQLFSAIVGGAIALRLTSSVDPKLLAAVAPLAEGLVVFVGVVSAGLILDSFRSLRRQRRRLTEVGGKKPNGEDVVKPLDFQSWITITIMEIVIVVSILAFWQWNPLRLPVGHLEGPTMMTVQWLNTIGLVLGMLGVVAIFIWGPPQPDFDEDVSLAVEPATVLQDGRKISDIIDANRRRKCRHQIMSRIGLGLVFCGFGVQLCAVWA
jgi:hypothetical protein